MFFFEETKQNKTQTGSMATWKGPFGGSTSRNKHPLDELLSLLQKSIRRSECDWAHYSTAELLTFRGTAGEKHVFGRVYNRLCVILVEDVSFSQLRITNVTDCLDRWHNSNPGDGVHDIELHSIVQTLCELKKLRLPSHLRAYYLQNVPCPSSGGGDGEEHEQEQEQDQVHLFRECLEQKNYDAFYYLYQIILQKKQTWKKLLLSLLSSVPPDARDTWLISQAAKDRKERFCFVFVLFLRYMHRNDGAGLCNDMRPMVLIPISDFKEPRELPDWSIDMHTSRGRKRGQTHSDFAEEGAQISISTRDEQFYRPALESAYNTAKRQKPEAAKNTSDKPHKPHKPHKPRKGPNNPPRQLSGGTFSNHNVDEKQLYGSLTPIAQSVTAAYKQSTFLLPDCVLKGPFDISKPSVIERLNKMQARFGYFQKMQLNTIPFTFCKGEAKDGDEERSQDHVWIRSEPLYTPDEYKLFRSDAVHGSCMRGHSETVFHIVRRDTMPAKLVSSLVQMTQQQALAACKVLVARWILDPPVGDTGLWNMLVYKDEVYGIDYEEISHLPCNLDDVTAWLKNICKSIAPHHAKALNIAVASPSFLRWFEDVSQLPLPFDEKRVQYMQRLVKKAHEKKCTYAVSESGNT